MAKSSPSQHEQGSLLDTAKTAAPATVAPAGSQLATFSTQLAELDKFAEENNLAVLTEGKGSFTAALSVADAIGRLKVMLTPAIMKPIMELQGTSLGFKTDKDKEGGYGIDTVRDVFIEATLKGFKMVGNQSNIVAGRFYATKEGFEDFLLRLAKKGEFLDYRDSYSTPKHVSDSEAIVRATATWTWKGRADKIENADFSIRVNKGQNADAIIGKAKRKLKARIYERITGTVISEGDAAEAVVVETRTVSTDQGAPAQPGVTHEKAGDEAKQLLKEAIGEHGEKANAWLLANNAIPAGGTYLDVSAKTAAKIIGKPKDFLKAIGAIPE